MHNVKVVTVAQFHDELKAQGVPERHMAFKCPRCNTIQSANDLIKASDKINKFEDAERYLAFSCIGRFTNDLGCDWTLGGLFQLHKYAVETDDGELHPRFQPATPAEAKAHMNGETVLATE